MGIFIALVLTWVAIRIIGANLYPQQNITREDPDANFPVTAPVAPTLDPAGSTSSDLDRDLDKTP